MIRRTIFRRSRSPFRPLTGTGRSDGGILLKNDKHGPPDMAGMIIFVGREYIVYGDACHWETTIPDTPVTTVDEFVAALCVTSVARCLGAGRHHPGRVRREVDHSRGPR